MASPPLAATRIKCNQPGHVATQRSSGKAYPQEGTRERTRGFLRFCGRAGVVEPTQPVPNDTSMKCLAICLGLWWDQHGRCRSERPGPFSLCALAFVTALGFSGCVSSAAPAVDLRVPPAFRIQRVASLDGSARFIAIAPNGDLVVTQAARGDVAVIPKGARAQDQPRIFASGLELPNGVAFRGDDLYVATWSGVIRYHYPSSQGQVLFNDMPEGGDHNFRALALDRDGAIYVSSGSTCNVCAESDPRFATVLRYDADGRHGHIYASGLRNASGLALDDRGHLWAVINERDYLGDDVPPDELTLVREGGDYGWPYCHSAAGHRVPNPEFTDAARCAKTEPPGFLVQAHSAPLEFAFYKATQFPAQYRGAAFIAFHGSWNRSRKTGYKVVAVLFKNGEPVELQDFVTGWLSSDGAVSGRPTGVAVAPDGSLYVVDGFGAIYRVWYAGA